MNKNMHTTLLLLIMCSAESSSLRVGVKSLKQSVKARALLSTRLSRDANNCLASTGCTCTEHNIVEAQRNCLLFTFRTQTKLPLFGDGNCHFDYDWEEHDCLVCPTRSSNAHATVNQYSQVLASRAGGSGTTTQSACVEVPNFSAADSYFQWRYTESASTGWLTASCTQYITPAGTSLSYVPECNGPTPPPTLATQSIDSYSGYWTLAGTEAGVSTTLTTTFTEGFEEEQSEQFVDGWKAGGEVTFGYSPPGGFSTSVKASYEASGQWQQSTGSTISRTTTTSSSITCTSSCALGDTVYAYRVAGESSSVSAYKMDVPADCLFACIAPGKRAPVCPPTYCDPEQGSCDCCWSMDWAAPDATDLPPLCEASHRYKSNSS